MRLLKRWMLTLEIILVLCLLFLVIFWQQIVITVQSGERGVLFKRFSGTALYQDPYEEGVHLIFPWDTLYIYNIREQQVEHQFTALSKGGLSIQIVVSIRYHPHRPLFEMSEPELTEVIEKYHPEYSKQIKQFMDDNDIESYSELVDLFNDNMLHTAIDKEHAEAFEKLPFYEELFEYLSDYKYVLNFLHQQIGPDYLEKVIIPEIQASIREEVGKYDPEEIYESSGNVLSEFLKDASFNLTQEFIYLDDLLVKEIILPPIVRQAIEQKLRQEQIALEYEYRLIQSEKEAERKRIEAQGIHDFQQIVSEGISDALLRWRGIEATLELSKSQNAKLVIIGGPDGLPLILNTGLDLSGGSRPSGTATPATGVMSATEINSMTSSFTDPGKDFNSSFSTPGGVSDGVDLNTSLTTPGGTSH